MHKRDHSHFYFVAEPRATTSTAATSLVRHADKTKMFEFLRRSEEHFLSDLSEWEPRPRSAHYYLRRSRGSAFSTMQNGGWNPQQDQEGRWVDIEVGENAGIAATVGRGSDGKREMLEGIAVAYALRLLYWAREASEEIGYRGSWDFALGGTGLIGKNASGRESHGNAGPSRYHVDAYEEMTSAHYFEIVETPGIVAGRLVGRLLRGLGVEELYEEELS